MTIEQLSAMPPALDSVQGMPAAAPKAREMTGHTAGVVS